MSYDVIYYDAKNMQEMLYLRTPSLFDAIVSLFRIMPHTEYVTLRIRNTRRNGDNKW